jgi:AcrR family transcriptional regulator
MRTSRSERPVDTRPARGVDQGTATATRPYHSVLRISAAAATRRCVLAAALALFEERGYAATTISEIAARADVSVNTLYTSVGGKPQLLAAMVSDAAADERLAEGMREVATATTAESVVQAAVLGSKGLLQTHGWVLGELCRNSGADPVIAAAVADTDHAVAAHVLLVAERVAALGRLRRGVSVTDAADVLWFHLGYHSWDALRARGWSWDRAAAWLSRQLGEAILTPLAD